MHDTLRLILMYFVLPVWLAAGFADWLCHRKAHIATTSGPKESLMHLLMFVEMGAPLLAALFFEVNALVLVFMMAMLVAHVATALWDVHYALGTREVTYIEQHVHSYLEMMPLMATVLVVAMHFDAFLSIFGAGPAPASYTLEWRGAGLPVPYIAALMGAILIFEIAPYLEELWRGVKARRALE